MHLALSVHSLKSLSSYPIHTLSASFGELAHGRQDGRAMDELTRNFLIGREEGMDRMELCLTDLEAHPH
jgi:hypothetical protein